MWYTYLSPTLLTILECKSNIVFHMNAPKNRWIRSCGTVGNSCGCKDAFTGAVLPARHLEQAFVCLPRLPPTFATIHNCVPSFVSDSRVPLVKLIQYQFYMQFGRDHNPNSPQAVISPSTVSSFLLSQYEYSIEKQPILTVYIFTRRDQEFPRNRKDVVIA